MSIDSTRGYRIGTISLICAATAWHAWVATQLMWMPDDWTYLVRVDTMSFLDYVMQDYNGHAMPLQFAFVWGMTKAFPMSFAAQSVVIALMTAAGIAAWSAAFAEIFGPRLRLLLPLSVIALTPISLFSASFWASAIQLFPLQAFMGAAVFYAVRASRGEPGAGWCLALTYALALLWWEKALLMTMPIAAVVLHCGSGRLRSHLRTLAPLVAVTLAYLPAYLWLRSRVHEPLPDWVVVPDSLSARAVQYFHYSWSVLPDLLVPAVLGGPWGTVPVLGAFFRRPDRSVMLALGTALLVAALVAAWLRGRSSWVPLALATTYVVTSSSLIMFSTKYRLLGPDVLYEDRYFPDVVAVLMLCAAMLLCRPRGHPAHPRAVAMTERVGSRALSVVGAAAAVAMLVSLGIANAQLWPQITPKPGREWVETVHAQLEEAGPASVRDGAPPAKVLEAGLWPEGFTVSRMFASLDPEANFGAPGNPIMDFDSDGNLRPATIQRSIVAEPGPQPACGFFLVDGKTVDVPLTQSLFGYFWGVELAVFSGSGGQLSLTVDGDTQQVAVPSGLSSPQFLHSGTVSEVSVRFDGPPDASACLAGLHAGEMVPGVDG